MSRVALLIGVLLLLPTALPAQEIPAGTLLPVMLGKTLDSRHAKAGQPIEARLMQDVPLPAGGKIRAGAQLLGHVVEVTAKPGGSRMVIAFERLKRGGTTFDVVTNLRSVASMMEVFDAQLPTNDFADRGTSPSDWTTVQIGGAAVYRGNGKVIADAEVVGKATDYGAVTATPIASRRQGCRGPTDDNQQQQAFWLFSPAACGAYGFQDLRIAHAGRHYPVGQIILESSGKVRLQGGSGLLLRVTEAAGDSAG